ncbi:MAG: hypothetical protein QOG63_2476 [Thermoleophilaceae bacterium]|jgi:hypothetical protein|nr:hypothetical protein [Thermoleophilaceae bacterium]
MPLVLAGDASAEEPRDETHARARKIRPEFTRGPTARVAGGRNQAEAELIQNILLEEGIPSVLRRSAGFDVPDFLAAGPRDVLVPESGLEAARTVLHSAEIAVAPEHTAPTRAQALRIVGALLAAAAITALIAWALVQAG